MRKAEWDKGFEAVQERQLLIGLELTAAERLAWLYQMLQLFLKIKPSAEPIDHAKTTSSSR